MANYYVDSVAGSDSNAGTSPGAGNAWATVQHAATTAVAGDKINVKASAAYAEQVAFATSGTENSPIVFEGYTSSPGDGGRATLTGSGSRSYNCTHNGCAGIVMRNFLFTSPTSRTWDHTGTTSIAWRFENCRMTKGTATPSAAFDSSTFNNWPYLVLLGCEIDNFTSTPFVSPYAFDFSGCEIHDNGSHGVAMGAFRGRPKVSDCLIYNNGGDGINVGSDNGEIILEDNTIDGNTGNGIQFTGGNFNRVSVRGNMLTNNGAYGLKTAAAVGLWLLDYNFFYNNTSGPRSGPAAGPHDVAVGADPYTNRASKVFSLNATSPGGGQVRVMNFPGAFPAGLTTSYRDGGAVQHQDSGGGGSGGLPLTFLHSGGRRRA